MPQAAIRTTMHDRSPTMVAGFGAVAERPEHDAVVERMRGYLEAHCTRVVTLAELARLTGFSQFHVCRLFRDAVGIPPYAYLVRARLARARHMIAAGEPLSSVAYATGFSDQSHLTRHFKRVFGVTPGQYERTVALRSVVARQVGSSR